MEINFSLISHGTGALIYFALAIYTASTYLRRLIDRAIFMATTMTGLWLIGLSAQDIGWDIPFVLRYNLELMRNAAWFGVLYSILGVRFLPGSHFGKQLIYFSIVVLTTLACMIGVTLYEAFAGVDIVSGRELLVLQIIISIAGIALVEQIWRNASSINRTGMKYLTIAIASIFAFDFVMYSDAFLFQRLPQSFWDTRGMVNALIAPLILMSMLNSLNQPLGILVSRAMMFHTATLTVAGVYLLFISIAGYYIQLVGGTWGEALRTLFITVALIGMVILISSPTTRARITVFISKNFFDYQYDYRDEWLRSTNTLRLNQEEKSLYIRSIQALGALIGAQTGAIWIINEDGDYQLQGKLNASDTKFSNIDKQSDVVAYFLEHNWIINLDEYLIDPSKYNLMKLPDDIIQQNNPWLIVPLKLNQGLTGFVYLGSPITELELNWENYDLLKIVALQACSFIEQSDSQDKLAESRQFEAVSQTSAFLVHDIKTIIAQLSLLVKNAEKHKSNPAFVDDMLRTTGHTVEKMERLLNQIRNPEKTDELSRLDIDKILREMVASRASSNPAPTYSSSGEGIPVSGDETQLSSVLAHITQNAIDACTKDGEVTLNTKVSRDKVYIFIQDNGAGMSEEYIDNELFKPFKSTKGLTGMGIGAYQSREYLRKIGGGISVTSEEGVGSCFTINIPLTQKDDNNRPPVNVSGPPT